MRIFLSVATENYVKKVAPIKTILDFLLEFGHTRTNPYPFFMLSDKKKSKRITGEPKKMRELIRKSNLLLAKISVPLLGGGCNICLAQYYRLPIVCFCL